MRAVFFPLLVAALTICTSPRISADVAQWDFDDSLAATTAHGPLGVEFAAPAAAPDWEFSDADVFGDQAHFSTSPRRFRRIHRKTGAPSTAVTMHRPG